MADADRFADNELVFEDRGSFGVLGHKLYINVDRKHWVLRTISIFMDTTTIIKTCLEDIRDAPSKHIKSRSIQ
jgi:hypothetical protein